MKKSELKLEKTGYNLSANTYKARSHYRFKMKMGRCLPSTIAQAKYFISEGICLDVLNMDDVEKIEAILNKHGLSGDYKYTKSKLFVRLQNDVDLHMALEAEYINQ